MSEMRSSLTDGDQAGARSAYAVAARRSAQARAATHDPLWRGFAALPLLREPVTAVRGIAAVADRLARGPLQDLLDAAGALDPAELRRPDGRIDVAKLAQAQPELRSALDGIVQAERDVADLPRDTRVSQVDRGRDDLADQLAELRATVERAETASRIAPPMLGAHGLRRYFVAFQNNAEARGTGGLVGVYGILEADRGRLRMTRVGSNQDFRSFDQPVISLGKEFDDRYNTSFGAAAIWVNANLSPHFPYAGQIWLAMWQRQFGEQLDGVIAVDPVMLSYLLEATGPVRLPTGEMVTASNVVELTESTVYSRFEDTGRRKEFLEVIALAVSEQVLDRSAGSPTALSEAVQRATGERRLLVWSRHQPEAAAVAETAIGGALPAGPGPFAGLVVNNAAGGKLDYYLDRTVDYALGACDSTGYRRSTVTVTLANDTPDTPLPDYVVIRADPVAKNPPRGSNILLVSLFGAEGAELSRVGIDGKPAMMTAELERGRPVFTMEVELAPQQSRRIVYELEEPVSDQASRVPEQPLARRQDSTVSSSACAPAPGR